MGNFAISTITPGFYDVALKASSWLQQVVTNVEIVDQQAAPVGAWLVNGDLDNDNSVTTTDLSAVLKNLDGIGAP